MAKSWGEKKPIYSIQKDGGFCIENYSFAPPFSSFFPGIAGKYGIPLWVFYVNRGQCIASLGTSDKDGAIVEFFPANKSYQNTSILGFRTFIKYRRESDFVFYEPFRDSYSSQTYAVSRRMVIYPYQLEIEEINKTLGIKMVITYFPLVNRPLPGLARKVVIRNMSPSKSIDIEVLDGLPVIWPYGVNQFIIKNMSRTAEAWMRVKILDDFVGFYNVKVDLSDRPEVVKITSGNFLLGVRLERDGIKKTKLIADPETVFGSVLDFDYPKLFLEERNFLYPDDQILQNRLPCAFTFQRLNIPPVSEVEFVEVVGQAKDEKLALRFAKELLKDSEWSLKAEKENKELLEGITSDVFTVSGFVEFDQYTAQSYLDNLLRGGYPVKVGTLEGCEILYLYGRKHGDLERDYNNFRLEPSFFSQGNGNYRDMNQNRRLDVVFHPECGDMNVKLFMNLIQLNGYNPLQINGVRFKVKKEKKGSLESCLSSVVSERFKEMIIDFLQDREFTVAEFVGWAYFSGIKPKGGWDRLVGNVLSFCERLEDATHIEGFWTDHWSYNLDLIEMYLSMYPEREFRFWFEDKEYTYFDTPYFIAKRKEKCVLTENGVRQYKSVRFDKEKAHLIDTRSEYKTKVRTLYGKGSIYRTCLIVKLLSLLATKIMNLDPYGVGIEMEADKPNWYDSLNGLPGLFGSSSAETMELLRLTKMLLSVLEKFKDEIHSLLLFEELSSLMQQQKNCLFCIDDPMEYWKKEGEIKENWRERTFYGISGKEEAKNIEEIISYLMKVKKVLESAVDKAVDGKNGIVVTYFYYIAKEWKELGTFDEEGRPYVEILRFEQHRLPLFLEGFVHYLRIAENESAIRRVYDVVKRSPLFDSKLSMYKVCASLKSESLEIGRCAVFTPGWLENESIWLHMEYKYLLELLKRNVSPEFYTDLIKTAICFQKPQVYRRSITENSSFLVSSAFPDRTQWGRGFVARLTGSTVEWLNIWLVLCVGRGLFYVDEKGRLAFKLQPLLPEWLFTSEERKIKGGRTLLPNSFAFNLFSSTLVVYHNPNRFNCYEKRVGVKKMKLLIDDGRLVEVESNILNGELAQLLRSGKIREIWAEIGLLS